MSVEDVFQQPVFTALVRRNIEREANASDGGENRGFVGAQIAPLVTTASTITKIRVSDVLPYGLGQFKAPDATPALFKAKPKLKEMVIELVLLEEMERFIGTEWQRLTSNDDAIARGALLSLVQRQTIMQQRNDNLTEWMRWQAFKGALTVTYPDGGTLTIDYGFDASHLPTASVPWTNLASADPLGDLFAWSQVGADDAGQYYRNVWLNTTTWRLLVYNANIRSYLSALGRDIMLPTLADIQKLMREGTGNFNITDGGYLPEGATNRRLTKWIPDNRILYTTDTTLNGQKIADVADGQVLVGGAMAGDASGGFANAPTARQGMQSEIIANPFSKNVFRRQASARMVRIYIPEAFMYAAVGS